MLNLHLAMRNTVPSDKETTCHLECCVGSVHDEPLVALWGCTLGTNQVSFHGHSLTLAFSIIAGMKARSAA